MDLSILEGVKVMKRNMGKWDRIIRAIVGVVLVVMGVLYLGFWWGILMLVIGILLLVTSIIGFCYLYTLCKCSTTKK
jgi:fatty acid desaturase